MEFIEGSIIQQIKINYCHPSVLPLIMVLLINSESTLSYNSRFAFNPHVKSKWLKLFRGTLCSPTRLGREFAKSITPCKTDKFNVERPLVYQICYISWIVIFLFYLDHLFRQSYRVREVTNAFQVMRSSALTSLQSQCPSSD